MASLGPSLDTIESTTIFIDTINVQTPQAKLFALRCLLQVAKPTKGPLLYTQGSITSLGFI